MGNFGGKQDQYAATYGGLNQIYIGREVLVRPLVTIHQDELLSSLVLIYLGGKREDKLQEGLKVMTQDKLEALNRIKKIAIRAVEYIKTGDIEMVAKLLNRSWEEKKKTNKVSNKTIDEAYDLGMANGAWGGKIMGAGGGGYMVFMCDPLKKEAFILNMKKYGLENVDFSIDKNGLETKIL